MGPLEQRLLLICSIDIDGESELNLLLDIGPVFYRNTAQPLLRLDLPGPDVDVVGSGFEGEFGAAAGGTMDFFAVAGRVDRDPEIEFFTVGADAGDLNLAQSKTHLLFQLIVRLERNIAQPLVFFNGRAGHLDIIYARQQRECMIGTVMLFDLLVGSGFEDRRR